MEPQYKLMKLRERTARTPAAWIQCCQWTKDLARVRNLRDDQQAAHPDAKYRILMLSEVA